MKNVSPKIARSRHLFSTEIVARWPPKDRSLPQQIRRRRYQHILRHQTTTVVPALGRGQKRLREHNMSALARHTHADMVVAVADVIAEKFDAAVESHAMAAAARTRRMSVST